jgi:archaetidylinositol phosphate synthase
MLAGFESEDVLYLLPLVTLCNGVTPFLIAASIGAPLFAIWVVIGFRRALRRPPAIAELSTSGAT